MGKMFGMCFFLVILDHVDAVNDGGMQGQFITFNNY